MTGLFTVTQTITTTRRVDLTDLYMHDIVAEAGAPPELLHLELHPEVLCWFALNRMRDRLVDLLALPAASEVVESDWCVEYHDEKGHLVKRVSS